MRGIPLLLPTPSMKLTNWQGECFYYCEFRLVPGSQYCVSLAARGTMPLRAPREAAKGQPGALPGTIHSIQCQASLIMMAQLPRQGGGHPRNSLKGFGWHSKCNPVAKVLEEIAQAKHR